MRLIDFEKHILRVKSVNCFSKMNILDFFCVTKNSINWMFENNWL